LDNNEAQAKFDTMTEEEAVAFMARAIRLAMERDGSSGGFVRIFLLTTKGQRVVTVYPHQEVSLQDHAVKVDPSPRVTAALPGFASPSKR